MDWMLLVDIVIYTFITMLGLITGGTLLLFCLFRGYRIVSREFEDARDWKDRKKLRDAARMERLL